jgi:hypothetical protein
VLKKTVVLAVLALAPLGNAFADPDVGCGAGTKIWQGQRGTIYKILASTTNGSFGSQTFGISSGTLGCHQDGVVTGQARISVFASANFDQLAADMAAGHGETLQALATLYNVSDTDRSGFYTLLQSHYRDIFTSTATTSEQAVSALTTVLKADSRYAHYVA